MTKDLNKGISLIEYNLLNLPKRLTISNSYGQGTNVYLYAANGRKLRVTKNTHKTDYVGSFIYENDSFKRLLVDNGYFEGGKYYFYVRDHLGNNRIVTDQNSNIVQSTQYYPFGMSYADGVEMSKQPYRYNGKELDSERGLNWYDYEARQKMNEVPVFTGMDPLAEKYYSISPYAYCANNPMKYIDPTGKKLKVANKPSIAAESIARIAATVRGSGIINSLIQSDETYNIKGVWWTYSSEFVPKEANPSFQSHTIKYGYNPSKNKWFNSLSFDAWEILGHELQHAGDWDDGRTEGIVGYEQRAVSFGNYLREIYGISPLRDEYKGTGMKGLEKGNPNFFQFANSSENISDFKREKVNKTESAFGFSYTKNRRKRYITVSYDENQNVSIRFYDNEEKYDDETEDW